MHDELTQVILADDAALHQNSDAPAVTADRQAAVLIPLVREEGEWHILFIRRASNERDRHSGQVAFPGGRVEAVDNDAVAAALRETIDVSIMGAIDTYITVSNYAVTPVVGIVRWPVALTLQSTEVARAFSIPLHWLRDRNNLTFRARQNMDPQSAARHPIIVYEPFDNEILWGATARMTLNFIKALDDGRMLLPTSAS